MRLDIYLVNNMLAKSRDRAKNMINSGFVVVNKKIITKPSFLITGSDIIELLKEDHKYVSRGAFKLKSILDELDHKFNAKNVLDIGSSTGGFTQVSLEYGARHVVAVDVGTAQLDKTLRGLNTVTVLEKTDARNINTDIITCNINILVSDVSFISQTRILPHILNEFKGINQVYILVKPQFELTKQQIGRGGIVRSKKDRQQALSSVKNCLQENKFIVKHAMDSPITGGDGNHEYILYAERIK